MPNGVASAKNTLIFSLFSQISVFEDQKSDLSRGMASRQG